MTAEKRTSGQMAQKGCNLLHRGRREPLPALVYGFAPRRCCKKPPIFPCVRPTGRVVCAGCVNYRRKPSEPPGLTRWGETPPLSATTQQQDASGGTGNKRCSVKGACLALVTALVGVSAQAAEPAGLQGAALKDRVAEVKKKVDGESDSLLTLYKYLHSHPELSLKEEQTSARL